MKRVRKGEFYYTVSCDPFDEIPFYRVRETGSDIDNRRFEEGRYFASKEDALRQVLLIRGVSTDHGMRNAFNALYFHKWYRRNRDMRNEKRKRVYREKKHKNNG